MGKHRHFWGIPSIPGWLSCRLYMGERTVTNKMWGPILDSLEWLHRNVYA